MLEEVELLVARGDDEVLADIVHPLAVDAAVFADDLERLALAERRVGQDDIVAVGALRHQSVGLLDRRGRTTDAVEIKVHRAQPHDLGDDVGAG